MEAASRLQTARFGLEDMRSRPERLRSGLYNVIAFGRMVTFALQNLRHMVTGFDEWYEEKISFMQSDPVMQYFYRLRNKVEKQAESPHVYHRVQLHQVTLEDLGDPPPGTVGFFFIDREGGSGWVVSLPDGRKEKYYVKLPEGSVSVMAYLPGLPSLPDLPNPSAADLAAIYVDNLDKILRDACEKIPELKGVSLK